jgi:hypothetical protein
MSVAYACVYLKAKLCGSGVSGSNASEVCIYVRVCFGAVLPCSEQVDENCRHLTTL